MKKSRVAGAYPGVLRFNVEEQLYRAPGMIMAASTIIVAPVVVQCNELALSVHGTLFTCCQQLLLRCRAFLWHWNLYIHSIHAASSTKPRCTRKRVSDVLVWGGSAHTSSRDLTPLPFLEGPQPTWYELSKQTSTARSLV